MPQGVIVTLPPIIMEAENQAVERRVPSPTGLFFHFHDYEKKSKC